MMSCTWQRRHHGRIDCGCPELKGRCEPAYAEKLNLAACPSFKRAWSKGERPSPVVAPRVALPVLPCLHLGSATGETVTCKMCKGHVELKTFVCSEHGTCTIGKRADGVKGCCEGCKEKDTGLLEIQVTADGIGDHLLGLTTAAGLVRDNPKRQIRYVPKHASLLPWLELFEGVFVSAPSAKVLKPHDTYHQQMKEKTAKRRDWYYADAAGTTPKLPAPKPSNPAAKAWAKQYAGCVVLSPWTAWRAANATRDVREWPLSSWLDLETLLLRAGKQVVILDNEDARNSRFQGRKIIKETPARVAALLSVAQVTIGNDSGMVHLAGCLRKPAIALCSLIPGEQVFGCYPSVHVINGPLGCTGCHWDVHKRNEVACSGMLCASLTAIRPSDVLEAVNKLTVWEPYMSVFPAEQLRSLFVEKDLAECTEWLPRYAKLWEVVVKLAPKRIAEIGVRAGYSSWTMLNASPGSRLIGIDANIDPGKGNSHGGFFDAWRHAEAICGPRFAVMLLDSHKVSRLPASDLAYVDGDHTDEGCYADLLLCERSNIPTILCDDYATPNLGVKSAIDRFMRDRPWLKGTYIDNGSTGLFLIERNV